MTFLNLVLIILVAPFCGDETALADHAADLSVHQHLALSETMVKAGDFKTALQEVIEAEEASEMFGYYL